MRILFAAAFVVASLTACAPRTGSDLKNELGSRQSGLPTPPRRPSAGAGQQPSSSDQAFRQTYRTVNIQTCINASRSQAASNPDIPPGTDFRPYCTCFIDRSMAGLSVDQLTRLNPGPREERISLECAREYGLLPAGAGLDEGAGPGEADGDGSGGK